ncbi:MAG: hypothetical protein IPP16_05730 [Acidimicrobiaceae bacterium]|nr:hypothetical protein [Acidimicrobiaceae bacterium]
MSEPALLGTSGIGNAAAPTTPKVAEPAGCSPSRWATTVYGAGTHSAGMPALPLPSAPSARVAAGPSEAAGLLLFAALSPPPQDTTTPHDATINSAAAVARGRGMKVNLGVR